MHVLKLPEGSETTPPQELFDQGNESLSSRNGQQPHKWSRTNPSEDAAYVAAIGRAGSNNCPREAFYTSHEVDMGVSQ